MKHTNHIFSLLFFLLISYVSFSQIDENEYVKKQVSFELTGKTDEVIDKLKGQNKNDIYSYLQEQISYQTGADDVAQLNDYLTGKIKSSGNTSSLFDRVNNGENSAIILIYRNIRKYHDVAANADKYDIDFESLNTIVFHKKTVVVKKTGANGKTLETEKIWSTYLLGTKEITLIYIDLDDNYYRDATSEEKKLSNSIIKIVYHTPFSKQSAIDLLKLAKGIGAMSSTGVEAKPNIKITIVELNNKRVKDPCDVVVTNKGFTKSLEFAIHDKNFSSFQAGLMNEKYRVNNFSLSGGNLTVKPDSTQKEEWRSNVFAAFEFHPFGYYAPWGRDIDNFEPLWKDIFRSRNLDRIGFARWLKHNTISRIGLYGGLRISKDPLSSLHAGFNYAISKQLYLNFGWTWKNDIAPQVTSVGNITSLDDALKYAKRTYLKPKFSWGLSFAPSTLMEMLGLNDKDKKDSK